MTTAQSFHLFDVRGDYPAQVNERLAFIVGRCLSELYSPKRILVASDTRESSPILKNFLVDGFSQDQKTKLFDLAEAPIPQFYYSVKTGSYDLGVMITASHSSPAENGFKFCHGGGLPFDQQEIITLKNLVDRNLNQAVVVPKRQAVRANTTDSYVNDLIGKLPQKRFGSKIIIDITKSSVVTPVLILFSRLGINFSLIKSSHRPGPFPAVDHNLLTKTLRCEKADLAIFWDADGDRAIFFDSAGNLIPMNFVLGWLASEAVSSGRGKKAVADIRSGLVVKEMVERAGGALEIVPAWGQYLKFAMEKDAHIVFGGEASGHFIFRDFFSIDDGIYAALRFLEIFERKGFAEKLKELKSRYFEIPEINIPCPYGKSSQILQKLTEDYRANSGLRVEIIDGLTVFGPNYKINLRESVTEPVLRLNLETHSKAVADGIISQIEEKIARWKHG